MHCVRVVLESFGLVHCSLLIGSTEGKLQSERCSSKFMFYMLALLPVSVSTVLEFFFKLKRAASGR